MALFDWLYKRSDKAKRDLESSAASAIEINDIEADLRRLKWITHLDSIEEEIRGVAWATRKGLEQRYEEYLQSEGFKQQVAKVRLERLGSAGDTEMASFTAVGPEEAGAIAIRVVEEYIRQQLQAGLEPAVERMVDEMLGDGRPVEIYETVGGEKRLRLVRRDS